MNATSEEPERRVDGWEAHRDQQRRHWLALSPKQRLELLEGMIHLAHQTGALGRKSAFEPADPEMRGRAAHE